jgi:hypothetical protein
MIQLISFSNFIAKQNSENNFERRSSMAAIMIHARCGDRERVVLLNEVQRENDTGSQSSRYSLTAASC